MDCKRRKLCEFCTVEVRNFLLFFPAGITNLIPTQTSPQQIGKHGGWRWRTPGRLKNISYANPLLLPLAWPVALRSPHAGIRNPESGLRSGSPGRASVCNLGLRCLLFGAAGASQVQHLPDPDSEYLAA